MEALNGLGAGITIENFAEHIRKVEEYIAYQDPESVLLDKIERQIQLKGCSSLPKAMLYYYALSLFLDCVFSGALETIFEVTDSEVCSAMDRGLALLQQPELQLALGRWHQQSKTGVSYSDEDVTDEIDSIHEACIDLEVRLTEYAREQKLL